MTQRMTEECREFLLDSSRTAVLATLRGDGRPHAAPIWFDLDGYTLIFTTVECTVKGRTMRRDSRVGLCIDEEKALFHFVAIEGTSDLTAGDPDLLYWATRIGGSYMGADRADEYGCRNEVVDELLARVTPQKIVAYKNISD